MRIKAIVIRTDYWTPGTDFTQAIVEAVQGLVQDNDIVAVSEKALAVAQGLIVDEAPIEPSLLSELLARLWMRLFWGGPLAQMTRMHRKTRFRLRNYPSKEGAIHKQTALRYAGLLQSLRHYSEGGIDASNLPYAYVSLPLKNASEVACRIQQTIEEQLGKCTTVVVVDGDTTYSFRNLHLAPRRVKTKGLIHAGGFLTFVAGRALGLQGRPTPVGVSDDTQNPDRALTYAAVAHSVCGRGAGRTVWEMSRRYGVALTEVTWRMLKSSVHRPVVILRVLMPNDISRIGSS